jgi:hypothetical protein
MKVQDNKHNFYIIKVGKVKRRKTNEAFALELPPDSIKINFLKYFEKKCLDWRYSELDTLEQVYSVFRILFIFL